MNSNEQKTLRTSRSTTKKKIGVDFTLARGPNNEEEAYLEVEDADREEDKADADGEEEEHRRHGVPAGAGAGTWRRTSAPVIEPTTSRRSPPPPCTTTHLRSLTREVEEQAPSRRRREWRVGTRI